MRQPAIIHVLSTAALLASSGASALEPQFACAGHVPLPEVTGVAAKSLGLYDPGERAPRGHHHALVVFAKFKGEQPRNTIPPDYAWDLFDPDLPGSLSHFYKTMSFGQFELSGTVLERRYESDHLVGAYIASDRSERGGFDRFASEILAAVDEDIDFAKFDNDGPDEVPNSGDDDGLVDYVFINVLSTPHGFILGGATGIAGLFSRESRSGSRSVSP